jgi:hypothetical protein
VFLGLFLFAATGIPGRLRAQEMEMQARIDINGITDKIGILIVSIPKGGSGQIATWHKNPEDNKRYATFHMPASKTQWRKMTFSFMPTKSGRVTLSLRGMWSKIDGIVQRNWVRFDDVSIDCIPLKNGGFEKVSGGKPRDWLLPERDGFQAVLLQGAGKVHTGRHAIEVAHDQNANQIIEVKADTIITVTAWQMASPDF